MESLREDDLLSKRYQSTLIIKHDSLQKGILLTVCIGFFLVCLDTSVVNVALDNLRLGLHIDVSGLQWTVTSYTLSFASLLLGAGALGDRIGARKVFVFGLSIFSIASLLCGLAPSLWFLIFARILQGGGAALLVANSLSILHHIFVQPRAKARAFGVWGGVGGIAIAAGPVLGGFLLSMFGWRSIFLLNIPFCLLGIYMVFCFIPKIERSPKQIKFFAQVISILALGSLTYSCISAGSKGWTHYSVVIGVFVFIISTIAFILAEVFSSSPLLPRGIFHRRGFTAALIVGIIINFGYYGQLFVLSLYFQQIKGYSALETGFAFLPQAIIGALTAFFCGKLTAKIGPGIPMCIGLLIGFSGFITLTFINQNSSYLAIIMPMLIVGFGMSFIAPSTVSAAMSSASSADGGVVSGIINAARQSGSVLGIAILGSLIGSIAFTAGMSLAFFIAAGFYFVGLCLTVFWILPQQNSINSKTELNVVDDLTP